jgi:hypothetical protein
MALDGNAHAGADLGGSSEPIESGETFAVERGAIGSEVDVAGVGDLVQVGLTRSDFGRHRSGRRLGRRSRYLGRRLRRGWPRCGYRLFGSRFRRRLRGWRDLLLRRWRYGLGLRRCSRYVGCRSGRGWLLRGCRLFGSGIRLGCGRGRDLSGSGRRRRQRRRCSLLCRRLARRGWRRWC